MAARSEVVEVVCALGSELGEGPVWDDRHERLVWVDIHAGLMHRTDVADGSTTTTRLGGELGCVGLRASGGYVAAIDRRIVGIPDDPADGVPVVLALVDQDRDDTRVNDGKPDPSGRFLVGTMDRGGAAVATGSLWRVDLDGRTERLLADVTASNGLAWSADGTTLYFVDTALGRIDAFDYDGATGAIGGRRTVVAIAPGGGVPDGLTIDREGGLWVALWGGWAVHRYVAGRLDRVVRLPVAQPTSCAFGGQHLDELYVTTAWEDLSTAERAAQPLAGAVFRARPGVAGRPADRFAG